MLRRLAALVLLALSMGACQRVTDADKEAALNTVRANIKAMEAEEMDAVLATIHPKSTGFEEGRRQIDAIFKEYDLAYTLEKAEVTGIAVAEIRVAFVMITKKRAGAREFTDNRVEGIHLLRRDGSAWKIWTTRVTDARPLETPPA